MRKVATCLSVDGNRRSPWWPVLIPGFVFQGVQSARIGPNPADRELTPRLIRALALSVGFLLLYILCLGPSFTGWLLDPQHELGGDPRRVGIVGIVLVFVIPAVAGHIAASFLTRQAYNQTTFWQTLFHRADDPGAMSWRRALFSKATTTQFRRLGTTRPATLLRMGVSSGSSTLGNWIGGRVTGAAYFTSYPEPRDVFIDEAWRLDEDGTFIDQISGPAGVWVPCTDARLVQIIPPPPPDPADDA